MPIVLVIVGLLLLVTAYNNTFTNLTSALATDVPGFAKWGLALGVVGTVGYIPGMQTISRWLLGLVGLVLVVQSYQANSNIFQNFANAVSSGASAAPTQTSPTTAAAASPGTASVTTAEATGTASSTTTPTTTASNGSSASSASTAATVAPAPYDPNGLVNSFLTQAGVSTIFNAAEMGFGGVA